MSCSRAQHGWCEDLRLLDCACIGSLRARQENHQALRTMAPSTRSGQTKKCPEIRPGRSERPQQLFGLFVGPRDQAETRPQPRPAGGAWTGRVRAKNPPQNCGQSRWQRASPLGRNQPRRPFWPFVGRGARSGVGCRPKLGHSLGPLVRHGLAGQGLKTPLRTAGRAVGSGPAHLAVILSPCAV